MKKSILFVSTLILSSLAQGKEGQIKIKSGVEICSVFNDMNKKLKGPETIRQISLFNI
jgi:hypothetical protein